MQSRRSILQLACAAVARGRAEGTSLRQPAFATLRKNTITVPPFADPVLIEGSTYRGIWQECGPHESVVYAGLDRSALAIAKNSHRVFFACQRADGQLPANVKMSGIGFGQIQMVVPIAATAWDVAQLAHDEEFLASAYGACSRWDEWLRKYRNTRKTGLVEGFCTYDTGHDNSPRWAGMPKQCPLAEARNCAQAASLPRLCPDLSATVYGGRVALARMAEALGKRSDANRWEDEAERIRLLILEKLYCAEDAAFYDLDAQDRFVRVRSDVISRVLGEHVLRISDKRDKQIFDEVWSRQLHNPAAFWTAYPFSSIAENDPSFVRPIPRNSWGGASQALTALRAPRWMAHYGKKAESEHLMTQWCSAIERNGKFQQQMDPDSGVFTEPDPGGYSPCALVYLDFSRRLRRGSSTKASARAS